MRRMSLIDAGDHIGLLYSNNGRTYVSYLITRFAIHTPSQCQNTLSSVSRQSMLPDTFIYCKPPRIPSEPVRYTRQFQQTVLVDHQQYARGLQRKSRAQTVLDARICTTLFKQLAPRLDIHLTFLSEQGIGHSE